MYYKEWGIVFVGRFSFRILIQYWLGQYKKRSLLPRPFVGLDHLESFEKKPQYSRREEEVSWLLSFEQY